MHAFEGKKTLLPFAVSAQTNDVFNDDVEKAAAFCYAELNREKAGGFFKKRESEKIVFVTEVYYPFWLAPLKGQGLLLDGLNVASHTITFPTMPDLKTFKACLTDRKMERQVHTNFLANNQNYFKASDQQKLVVEGLINDAEFTLDFLNSVREITPTNSPIAEGVFISPAVEQDGVIRILQSVENTCSKLAEELADLNEIIRLINLRNQEAERSLREEIRIAERKFNARIPKIKSIMTAQVSKINKEYSAAVTKISTKYDQKLKVLHKQILKLEKSEAQFDKEMERVEAEIRTAAINKADSAERKWKERREQLKAKRPAIASGLKEKEKQIQEIEDDRSNALFQLKQNSEVKIKEASKNLIEIETSRDAEIKIYQTEMEKIEELTSNIIKKIDELTKSIETTMLDFDELGTKQQTQLILIYMPFYLSCYQSRTHKRYTYLAPSIVSEGGFSTRLKCVGKTKISQLLQPRSKRVVSILNSFIGLLEEDVVFNREISEACTKANMLQMKKAQEAVKNGLNVLKEQRWLSDSEFESFSQETSQLFL